MHLCAWSHGCTFLSVCVLVLWLASTKVLPSSISQSSSGRDQQMPDVVDLSVRTLQLIIDVVNFSAFRFTWLTSFCGTYLRLCLPFPSSQSVSFICHRPRGKVVTLHTEQASRPATCVQGQTQQVYQHSTARAQETLYLSNLDAGPKVVPGCLQSHTTS